MKVYKVWVNFQGGYYTTVRANNRDEAMDIAYDEADTYEIGGDWDVNVEVYED